MRNKAPQLAAVAVAGLFLLTACAVTGEPTAAPGGGAETPAVATPTQQPAPFGRTVPPTPLSLSGLDVVEHDPSYAPTGLSNGRYVSIGQDGEVYLIDIASGENERLTSDGHRKRGAVISGGHVAWTDESRQVPIHDNAAVPPEGYANDIFVLDLATGEVTRVTETPAR